LIDVASLIGVDAPAEISRVNVSTRHRRADEIPPALRERIIELNQHDIQFYNQVVKWKKEKTLPAPIAIAKPVSGWVKHNFREPPLPRDISGSVSLISPVPNLVTNEQKILSIEVQNQSIQNWGDDPRLPVRVSYHWLHPSGATYLFDGQRTMLPKEGIPAGTSISADISVTAPSEPGVYTLVVSLVQEGFFWFERRGFGPAIIQVVVGNPAAVTEASRRRRGWAGLVNRIKSIHKAAQAAPPRS
jgi:hypothetical protein